MKPAWFGDPAFRIDRGIRDKTAVAEYVNGTGKAR